MWVCACVCVGGGVGAVGSRGRRGGIFGKYKTLSDMRKTDRNRIRGGEAGSGLCGRYDGVRWDTKSICFWTC